MATYQSTIVGNQDGQTVDVIMGWSCPGVDNSGDAETLAHRISDGWFSAIMGLCVDDYVQTRVDVIGVEDPTIFGTWAETHAGAVEDAPLPEFVVGRVKLDTGYRGRSFQGRWGYPGLPVTVLHADDGNALSTAAVTAMQTAVNAFYVHVATGAPSYSPVVISRIHGGAPRPFPIATAVTAFTVQSRLGSRVSRRG